MFALRELLHDRSEELAAMITAEHGKTLPDARGEVQRGIEVVEFACGIPHLLKGEYSDGVATGVDAWSLREPLGVVAGITPFNFPVMVPLWMHPIAIATGNAFVLKPSEQGPVAVDRDRRALRRGRVAAGRPQRRARRSVGRRGDPGPPRDRRGVVRRFDPGRPADPSTGFGRGQAGPGPRRGQEPRRRAPGRRPGSGGRGTDRGGLRFGRAALHGRVGRRRGRRGGRPAGVPPGRPGPGHPGRARK